MNASDDADFYDDPGFLRHCDWPGCPAGYNIAKVMDGLESAPGWRQYHGSFWSGLRLCAEHAPTLEKHQPKAHNLPSNAAQVACSCGADEEFAGNIHWAQARDWWARHVEAVTA